MNKIFYFIHLNFISSFLLFPRAPLFISIVHLSVVPPFTLLEDKSLKVNLLQIKPNNQITIGYKKLTALPKNGGAKVFEGASDKQIMTYFKQLTGSKLPSRVKLSSPYQKPSQYPKQSSINSS
jgi:hypothetical protein